MSGFSEFILSLFRLDSIWSVVFRGVIWLVVSLIIIISLDKPDIDRSVANMKANLGFFFLFLVLGTGLTMLLFSYQLV